MSSGKILAIYVCQCSIKHSVGICVNYHVLAYKQCWTEIQWLSLGFLEHLVFLSKGEWPSGRDSLYRNQLVLSNMQDWFIGVITNNVIGCL